jgi:hypothetical protein
LEKASHVGLRKRLAIPIAVINPGIDPGAFAEQVGELTGVFHDPVALLRTASERVSGFRGATFEEGVTQSEGFLNDSFEKGGAGFRGEAAEGIEGEHGPGYGEIDFRRSRLVEGWGERRSVGGVDGVEGVAGGLVARSAEIGMAGEVVHGVVCLF